jgi:hypothetical protein
MTVFLRAFFRNAGSKAVMAALKGGLERPLHVAIIGEAT